ncbi:MAG: hypothetical protein ACYTGF_17670 [Planctomycetota bacterium]
MSRTRFGAGPCNVKLLWPSRVRGNSQARADNAGPSVVGTTRIEIS